MPQITIRLHSDLAEMASGPNGARTLSALWAQAARVLTKHGRHVAYAPVLLPQGVGCAMSIHAGPRGTVVELDRPGTLIPGRDVVVDRRDARTQAPLQRRGR